MLTTIIGFLIAQMSTVLASWAHGADEAPKGVLMGLHTAVIAGALYYLGVPLQYLPIALTITAGYWFLLRSGRLAKAELDAMAVPSGENIAKVVKAYLLPFGAVLAASAATCLFSQEWRLLLAVLGVALTVFFPAVACELFDYAKNAWPDTEQNRKIQRKQRAKVEIAIALVTSGPAVALLTVGVGLIF